MSRNSILLLGDRGDFDSLEELSRTHQSSPWGCTKGTRQGDELWFYIQAPQKAIVAFGEALKNAKPGKKWDYETEVGRIQWILNPVTLGELRGMFPEWGWTKNARGKTHLDDNRAEVLRSRLARDVPAVQAPDHDGKDVPNNCIQYHNWTKYGLPWPRPRSRIFGDSKGGIVTGLSFV